MLRDSNCPHCLRDLTSEAFLNSFERFVSRRGLSKVIYCDNATNFIAAHKANSIDSLVKIRLFGGLSPPDIPHTTPRWIVGGGNKVWQVVPH